MNHHPVKVLHVRVVKGSGGGPDKTILRSAKHLKRAGFELTAAYLHAPDDPGIETLRETARQQRCPFEAVPDHGPTDARVLGKLLQLCRKKRIDVWHAHDYKSEVLGLLIRQRYPMKLVTTLHGFTNETWRTRLYVKIADHAIRRYDHAFAVSPELVSHCRDLGMDDQRITHLPNAIEAKLYERTLSRPEAKQNLGIEEDAVVIGVVGRLSIEKGVDRALDMLPALLKLIPKTQLHIVGDGPQKQTLQAHAERLQITEQVRWHGWCNDVRPHLQAMNALLLPSRTEGLANVVLEAMATGVPIAATPVGAVSEALEFGRCGRLLSRFADDWPWAISSILRPGSHVVRMTEAAKKRVHQQYSFARRMQRVGEVYTQLASDHSERAGNRRAA